MKRALPAVGAAALLASGCLLDLYGGDPRLQVRNTSGARVPAMGLGDPEDPTWTHDFDPVVRPDKYSEVVDLPVAGTLRVWVRVSDSARSWDSALVDTLSLDVGEFRLLEVSNNGRWKLSTSR